MSPFSIVVWVVNNPYGEHTTERRNVMIKVKMTSEAVSEGTVTFLEQSTVMFSGSITKESLAKITSHYMDWMMKCSLPDCPETISYTATHCWDKSYQVRLTGRYADGDLHNVRLNIKEVSK
jgi:hypothetical protein